MPTENIDDHTIYFVPNSQDANTRDEYMYVGNQWEMIGSTTIDLSDYPTYDDISIVQGLTTGIPAATITVGNTSTVIYNNKLIWVGSCTTTARVNAKVATCDNFVLEPGCIVGIKFTNGTEALTSYTLNVNGTGAYPIYYNSSALSNLYLNSNTIAYFQYQHSEYLSGKAWIFLFTSSPIGEEVFYGASNTSANVQTKIISITGKLLHDYSYTSRLAVVKFSEENTHDNPRLRTSSDSTSFEIQAINENDLYWKAGDTVVFIVSGSIARILFIVKPIPTVTPVAALTTGVTIGSIDINGTTTTFYAPAAPTPTVYTMSITGPTINLLADGVAASTITLPIWDGTISGTLG